MIDSHCHLGLAEFDADRQAVLDRARAAGVTAIIDVGIGPDSWERTLTLAAQEPDVWPALGLHPNDVAEAGPGALSALAELVASEAVVAIGETGLDYHWQRSPREHQVAAFIAQLDIARRHSLPVIIHCRDAYDDMLAILAQHGQGTRGVVHCFGGTQQHAEQAMALGYRISVGGPLTYKNAAPLRSIIGAAPPEMVLIETDAPYLAPHPLRGQRNEPAHVIYVADALASVRGSDQASVRTETDHATHHLFRCFASRQGS